MSRFARRAFFGAGVKTVPVQTTVCVWPNNPTPAIPSDTDTQATELGLKFTSVVDTRVVGVRFYKGSANTGTHVGSLWTAGGTLLASVTFSGETASGWQTQFFPVPVAITADTTYVISYHTNVGRYAADSGYFASAGTVQGILVAPANSVTANGVYAYGVSSTFPNQTFGATNYWVDVLVEDRPIPDSAPVITQFTASPGAVAQAESTTLSWAVHGTQPITLSIDHGIGTVTGTQKLVAPTATTTYTLTAANGLGQTSAQTTVTVVPTGSLPLTINGAVTYQTIDGVGTNINSLSWNNDNSAAAIDMLADDMGQTLWRVVFDMMDWETTNDNGDPATPDWAYYNPIYSGTKFQNLWGTLGYLNQKGFSDTIAVSLMGIMASWMGGSTIPNNMEDEAVEMITTMMYYARNTAGVTFGILDPFNEMDWGHNEGPTLSAAKYVRLLEKISAKLDAMGLSDIRFLGPNTADTGAGVNTYIPAMMASSTVMSKLDHFGLHSYSGGAGNAYTAIKNSSYANLNFWMTEYAYPYDAFALLEQNASGLIVWEGFDSVYNHAILNGLGSEPGNDDVGSVPIAYNKNTKVYTRRKEFYQNKQIFKYLLPGSVRMNVSGTPKAYAFRHAASGRVTIVAYNDGSSTQTVTASFANLPLPTAFEYYKTDNSSNFARGADSTVSGSSCTFAIPAGAIVTLTGVAS